MRITRVLTVPLLALLLTSCFTDEEDKVILTVTCSDATPKAGHIVRFDIETFTTDNSRIAELSIESFDAEQGTKSLEQIAADVSRFEYSYEYTVPTFRDNDMTVDMRFRSRSESGNTQSVLLKLLVSTTLRIEEHAGVTLYSPYSGRQDGFSLATMQPLLTSQSDDEDVDLHIPASTSDPSVLSRSLHSKTGIRFTKANNFDYASATVSGVNDVFKASQLSNSADNIEVNDVILFGRDGAALGVMKIVAVADNDGTDNDSITLNLKMIE